MVPAGCRSGPLPQSQALTSKSRWLRAPQRPRLNLSGCKHLRPRLRGVQGLHYVQVTILGCGHQRVMPSPLSGSTSAFAAISALTVERSPAPDAVIRSSCATLAVAERQRKADRKQQRRGEILT